MATTVSSSVSQTIISLLGTVGSNCQALSARLFESCCIQHDDMLDRYVQRAKVHQFETHLVEDRNWRRNLLVILPSHPRSSEKTETSLSKEYAQVSCTCSSLQ